MSRMEAQAAGEARFELAAMAASAARRNRPTHLILMGFVLALVAAIALLVSFLQYQSAQEALRRQSTFGREVLDRVAELKAWQKVVAEGKTKPVSAQTEVGSILQAAAAKAGLKASANLIPSRSQAPTRFQDVQRRKISYDDVRDESLEVLLKWLENATKDVPGLEVYDLQVRPEANVWAIKVTFARWERASGT